MSLEILDSAAGARVNLSLDHLVGVDVTDQHWFFLLYLDIIYLNYPGEERRLTF